MTSDSHIHDQFRARVPDELPVRRLAIFLVLTFSLNWLPVVYFLLEGIRFTDRNLPVFTYNAVMIFVSFSPAVGHLLTRWLTNEGFGREQLLLRFRLRTYWREYAAAAVVPLLLAVIGIFVYFAVFPQHLAAQPLEAFTSSARSISGVGTTAALFIVLLTTVVSIGPGALIVFGEELGWRAYLLPKLAPLGLRTAAVLTGVVWGVWHWPYIYIGLNYPAHPWLGMVAMLWVTILYGTFLAWATFRTGSIWPAAVGHAAFNASARWGPMVADETPNLALGPTSGGIIASLGWLVLAGWLFTQSSVFTRSTAEDSHISTDEQGE